VKADILAGQMVTECHENREPDDDELTTAAAAAVTTGLNRELMMM
jgi:hypothetical protein